MAAEAAGKDEAGTSGLTDAQADTDPPQSPDQDAEAPRRRWSFLTELVVLFAIALTIALVIKTFVVQPFYIPTISMQNTLLVGDKVLVNKLVYHTRPIHRGDIVVFNGQGSWDPPEPATQSSHNPLVRVYDVTLGALFRSIKDLFGTPLGQTDYIKRVIGVPGDHVACCNAHGQITVNGVAIDERSYLAPGARPSQYHFRVVVPPGRLWVMGDNRFFSADSRLHQCGYPDPSTQCVPYDRDGTIPEDKVIGRAFMIVWPPSQFGVLQIPATFNQPALSRAAAAALSSPAALPLAGGLIGAIPLTALERRLRLRLRQRRSRPRT